jgi:hypothetical protein
MKAHSIVFAVAHLLPPEHQRCRLRARLAIGRAMRMSRKY